MSGNEPLAVAEFDPRLPRYFLLVSSFGLLASIIGIPLLPFWILWIGRHVHRRQYESMSAQLTRRSLNINRGFLFKTQKNIPLDKITDLAVNEGPILRHLGLCSLQVETAGGGQGTTMGHASLPGVVDALAFRDAVLEQRDRVSGIDFSANASSATADTSASAEAGESNRDLLIEIRDLLARIAERGGR